MKNILVFSEDSQVACRILGTVGALTERFEAQLSALSVNHDPENLLMAGADVVYNYVNKNLEQHSVELYKSLMLEAIQKSKAGYIFIGATKRGRELAPRIAAALNAGCLTECQELEILENGWMRAKRLTYGGSALSTEVAKSTPIIASLYPRKEIETKKRDDGKILEIEVPLVESDTRLIEKIEKSKGLVDLESAQVIVSGGRGIKSQEDLKMLRELARTLDGEVGCSRPIAADQGWMEDWVGISGKKVTPRLYLACGISGTIQHAAGIRGSRLIISINQDVSAGIHQISDYSIIGDIYEVVPALIKALKELN